MFEKDSLRWIEEENGWLKKHNLTDWQRNNVIEQFREYESF